MHTPTCAGDHLALWQVQVDAASFGNDSLGAVAFV